MDEQMMRETLGEQEPESFEELIAGRYHGDFTRKVQQLMDRRFAEHRQKEEQWAQWLPAVEKLCADRGLDPADAEGLTALLEKEAGARERREALREWAACQTMRQWLEEASGLGERYPGFDLREAMQEEDFTGLLRRGLTVEQASEKIVALAEKMGYLNDGNKKIKITVVSDDAGKAQEMENAAKAGAEKGSEKAEVNSAPRSRDERTVKKLQAENPELYKDLTPAKVRLIEAIMQYDGTMTYEKGAAMKVSELAELLEDLADEYEDLVSDELEDKFENRYDEAKAETERKIAAVYGEEYLAAWDKYTALETAFELLEDKAENVSLSDEDIQAILALLGIEDKALISENGAVTPDSVDDYLDKHFDDDSDENEEKEEAIEDILDKYDEDEYVLTEADLAALSEAWGETLSFATLEEAEEFIDDKEDELDEMKDAIELTKEQKAEIKALKEELKNLKKQIREEMKSEIDAAKEELRRQKEERLA